MEFKWILIGLIFLLPINIFGLDILPDFLGYAFIIYGLYLIRQFNFKFKLAMIPVFILLLFSSFLFIDSIFYLINKDSILIHILTSNFNYILFLLPFKDYSIIYSIFALLLYYGIHENASKFGYNGLAERSKNLCFLILFYTIITSVPAIMVLPTIIYSILIYIITIYELFVIIDARQTLEQR
ncbi:hypothetical protein KHQ81_02415 [Mycoplasmatota bacterium]|nr:hypothetical protein KHQ81_02415 [Mycoplasmatota bacterium]